MPTACPVTKGFNAHGRLQPINCGQWKCKDCARHLARLWAWRVRIHIENNGGTAYFWTLTLRGKYHNAEQGFQVLPRLWNAFRMHIQRSTVDWSYCAFVEGQPKRDYMPHFHIISLLKCPERLKDVAMQSGFGYEAKESKVNGPKAASYCAKYASKISPKTPKGFRRVRASRDWAKLPDSAYPKILVKSKAETVTAYLTRVSDTFLLPINDLWEVWNDVMMEEIA